jgi:hypothetical protein
VEKTGKKFSSAFQSGLLRNGLRVNNGWGIRPSDNSPKGVDWMVKFNGTEVTVSLTPEQAKVLIALLDNSVVSQKAVSEDVYLGLVAFRDQLTWDVGAAIHVDTNDPQQMGVLYRQVEQMLAAPSKQIAEVVG